MNLISCMEAVVYIIIMVFNYVQNLELYVFILYVLQFWLKTHKMTDNSQKIYFVCKKFYSHTY